MQLFVSGPFLRSCHSKNDTIEDSQKNCLRDSCFDAATAERAGALAISFKGPHVSGGDYFHVISSVFGSKKIKMIRDLSDLSGLPWVFESNQKHNLQKDKLVNGKIHSAMLLSDKDAQSALTNGVMYGRSVYNKFNGQWYKFNRHRDNLFHGFPIDLKVQSAELMSAVKFMNTIVENREGHVFGDAI